MMIQAAPHRIARPVGMAPRTVRPRNNEPRFGLLLEIGLGAGVALWMSSGLLRICKQAFKCSPYWDIGQKFHYMKNHWKWDRQIMKHLDTFQKLVDGGQLHLQDQPEKLEVDGVTALRYRFTLAGVPYQFLSVHNANLDPQFEQLADTYMVERTDKKETFTFSHKAWTLPQMDWEKRGKVLSYSSCFDGISHLDKKNPPQVLKLLKQLEVLGEQYWNANPARHVPNLVRRMETQYRDADDAFNQLFKPQ